jgi:hypothetical protein
MNAPIELFFAHGVTHVDVEHSDAMESVELVRIPEELAVTAAASGKINDAVTVAALLRYGVKSGLLQMRQQERV